MTQFQAIIIKQNVPVDSLMPTLFPRSIPPPTITPVFLCVGAEEELRLYDLKGRKHTVPLEASSFTLNSDQEFHKDFNLGGYCFHGPGDNRETQGGRMACPCEMRDFGSFFR